MEFNNGIPEGLELDKGFDRIFDFIESTNECAFITGRAGTGKSTLLQHVKAKTAKNVAILAPTGIAAINVGGQTIHSFFGFPWHLIEKGDVHKRFKMSDLFGNLDTLIIDEVSMLRADLMNGVEYALRINMDNDIPFGGIQTIFFGDMYQLPPVVKEKELNQYFEPRYGGCYFFNANVFNKIKPKYFELTKIYRQTDKNFLKLLNRVRCNEVTREDLELLNQRVDITAGEDRLNPHLILTPTNRLAGGINEARLAELDAKEYTYQAIIRGEFPRDAYPTAYHLKLKKGAQVMLIKNDRYKRWVNGTLAVIEDVAPDCVKVLIDGGVYEVLQEEWEQFEYTYNKEKGEMGKEVVGTFTQYPIKLAWAVTIHKSQGHTFDNIIINLGNGAFSHGQVYVALSRCRTFEGISLVKPIRHKDIIFDKRVCRFTDKFVKSELGIKS